MKKNSLNGINGHIMAFTYIYTRVSTPQQNVNSDNNSIDTQMSIATDYAIQNNMEICNTVSEVCSAREVNKQKELVSLFKIIKNQHKYDIVNILVLDVSRFTRDLFGIGKYFGDLRDYNVTIIAITDNVRYKTNTNDIENIRFIERIVDAKKESDIISKRAKISYDYRKAKGYLINAPYGKTQVFKKDRYVRLTNKPEVKNINLILKLRSRNLLSINDIVNYLAINKITHRNGKPWTKSRVQTILRKNSTNTITQQLSNL